MTLHEHMTCAAQAVRRERERLEREVAAQVPAIREIAQHGKTAKERELARRWLALAE